MGQKFHDWDKLTKPERIERCRAEANEEIKRAESVTDEAALEHLRLAEQWLELADELTRRNN